MTRQPASLSGFLRACLATWFAPTFSAESGLAPCRTAAGRDERSQEARRRAVRDVTDEQLGTRHWSCHTPF